MKSTGVVRVGVVVAACLCAASAFAQTDDGAPGLLGRSRYQNLDLTISASDAYDDNLIALINQSLPNPETQVGGSYQGLSTSMQYRKRFRYATFSLGENSIARYYPSLVDSMITQHAGVAAFSVAKHQTTFAISQSAIMSPFYVYSTIPALGDSQAADVPAVAPDQSASLRQSLTNASTASFSQGLGRHVTLNLSGSYENTAFQHEDTDLRTGAGSGRLTYRLLNGLGFVAGYTYERGDYTVNSAASTVTMRTYDLGIDFSRTISASRRTTVAFHTGTTAVADSTRRSIYQIVGDARIAHRLTRSWRASASYRRGVGLVTGIPTPTLSNALAIGLDGALSRRMTASVMGGYSRDQIGVTVSENMGNTYSGSASMRYALTRLVSMSGTYVVYRYRFDQNTLLPEGIPPDFQRQELRFGVDVSLPLVR